MFVVGLRVELEQIGRRLAALVDALDPESVPLPTAVEVWDAFARIERLGATAATLMTRRVDESKAWKRTGARSVEQFMANRAGTGPGQVKKRLATSRHLKEVVGVDRAARSGQLSVDQAAAVAEAAVANPAAEQSLLDVAASGASLAELNQRCGQAKAAADHDAEARFRRIHAQRSVREWTAGDGSWHLHATGTTVAGQRFMAALQRHRDHCFADARRDGSLHTAEALSFDALMRMAEHVIEPADPTNPSGAAREADNTRNRCGVDSREPGERKNGRRRAPTRYLGLIRADLSALRRGKVRDGELCEIAGYGPIPIAVAQELLGESLLRLVLTRGYDVINTTALGRAPNAAQLAALLWHSPGCEITGCAAIARIQNDHIDDWARTHHTRVDELQRLCQHHHNLKTRHNWAVDGTGHMIPPDHPKHPSKAKQRPRGNHTSEPRAGPDAAA